MGVPWKVVCLTRCESSRDRYRYTHPSPAVDLHTREDCQIPERFSSPAAAKWRARASRFTAGSARTGSFFLCGVRENAWASEMASAARRGEGRNSDSIIVSRKRKWETRGGYLACERSCDDRCSYIQLLRSAVCACNECATTLEGGKKRVTEVTVTEASFSDYRQGAK